MISSTRSSGAPSTHPNGHSIELSAHGYSVAIATVGATVRSLEFEGRPLIASFAADRLRPLFRGALLAPWPNRIVDGRYRFGGREHLVPINEHARDHALHGLVLWNDFAVRERSDAAVELSTVVTARDGYPFTLGVEVRFELTADGLRTSVESTNLGADAAPYGVAPHPYLVAGTPTVDSATLALPAARVLDVDPDRLIPRGIHDVDALNDGALDFRTPRPVGDVFIDHAYTGLPVDERGRCRVALTDADGRGAHVTWDARVLPWVQIHTADRPEPEFDRSGLAVEPMTCAPDAFNSGEGLVVLEPGASHSAEWTIGAV